MTRIEEFLLIIFETGFHFFNRTDRDRKSHKFTPFFRINAFRNFGYGFINILLLHHKKMSIYHCKSAIGKQYRRNLDSVFRLIILQQCSNYTRKSQR
ncbi:hypothetical protein EZS27_022191 [termite gut metagenome]|uniref:Uncharacterized protein n=1 Tax=termite gut metagenome TaxID=433724 RepID=A0A5J4R5Y1_9ZZZZ